MFRSLPAKDRVELMMAYKKTNPSLSYYDMIKQFNSEVEEYTKGGKVKPAPIDPNLTILQQEIAPPIQDNTFVQPPIIQQPLTKQSLITKQQPHKFNRQEYTDKLKIYTNRESFSKSPLKGREHLITKAVEDSYNLTGVEIPPEFMLTQGQQETQLGTKLKSRNNIWNVGNYDDGRVKHYKNVYDAALDYSNLIAKDYLRNGKKTIDDLLSPGGYVNFDNKRYASDPNYENKISKMMDYTKRYIKNRYKKSQ